MKGLKMAKKFAKGLDKAWYQYQDLYDRHMTLLRDLGEATDGMMLVRTVDEPPI
jgi:hypothetical protein